VVEKKGVAPKVAVQCPEGTVITAGGYLVTTSPQGAGAYVTGNHPLGDNGWGIEAVEQAGNFSAAPGTQQIEVFGVCLAGAQLASADMTQLKFPRVVFTGSCAGGATVASLGYEVVDGRMLPYSVQRATSSLLVADSDSSGTLRVTTMCISWPPPPPIKAGVSWPLIGGIGLLALLAVLLTYRWRSRRAKAGAGFDVVIRSEAGGFDLERLREVP
jgi:hypothetical protein